MPQIEVMLSDLPHTLYKTKKTGKKVVVDDDSIRLQEEANRRAMERRTSKEKESYSIEEIFAGAADE